MYLQIRHKRKVVSVFKHHVIKKYGRVDVQLHTFLNSGLYGSKWSASRPARFNPGENNHQNLLDWVEVKAGKNAVVKTKFPTSVGNRTLFVQSITLLLYSGSSI
jgi:hypothetical protein